MIRLFAWSVAENQNTAGRSALPVLLCPDNEAGSLLGCFYLYMHSVLFSLRTTSLHAPLPESPSTAMVLVSDPTKLLRCLASFSKRFRSSSGHGSSRSTRFIAAVARFAVVRLPWMAFWIAGVKKTCSGVFSLADIVTGTARIPFINSWKIRRRGPSGAGALVALLGAHWRWEQRWS